MKKTYLFVVLIQFFFSPVSLSFVKDMEELISYKYRRGPYLIYDCNDEHWACVSKEGHDLCKKLYKLADEKSFSRYDCLIVKKYEDKFKCHDKQLKLVNAATGNNFCFRKNNAKQGLKKNKQKVD